MTSKEALERLYDGYQYGINGRSLYDIISQDLDRLEELQKDKNKFRELYEVEKHDKLVLKLENEEVKKAIEIILKYKIRPSTFVFTIKNYREMYGKDLTLEKAYILLDFCGTQEEYELLKEVLEDE